MSEDKAVTAPDHYMSKSGVECSEIAQWLGYWRGQAFAYVWRHKHKGQPIRDLEKALECLGRDDSAMWPKPKKGLLLRMGLRLDFAKDDKKNEYPALYMIAVGDFFGARREVQNLLDATRKAEA